MYEVVMYTDGSCFGNPGKGGYGVYMYFIDNNGVKHEKELFGGYDKTTNNRMELMSVIAGLGCLKGRCRVSLYTDSKYVSDAITKGWLESWVNKGWKTASKASVKNVDLWKTLVRLLQSHEVSIAWLEGHNGNKYNERVDKLAKNAAKSTRLSRDLVYEESELIG